MSTWTSVIKVLVTVKESLLSVDPVLRCGVPEHPRERFHYRGSLQGHRRSGYAPTMFPVADDGSERIPKSDYVEKDPKLKDKEKPKIQVIIQTQTYLNTSSIHLTVLHRFIDPPLPVSYCPPVR